MERTYSVGELAEVGGVSRRTVRYYVQEGLLHSPVGLGRGARYGPKHLERLLRVKSMQERGMSLDAIRAVLRGDSSEPQPAPTIRLRRSLWRRVEIVPGVELHVATDWRLPPPGRLAELAEWCRTYLFPDANAEEERDAEA